MRDLLLIDIGNTNVKWAYADQAHIGELHRKPCGGIAGEAFAQTCWGADDPPQRVFLSNVAGPDLEGVLVGWMRTHWGLSIDVARPTRQAVGVTNGYTDPSQLGIDRWLTLLAVHQKIPVAACIVDCGTAITLDVLTRTGEHLGGMILPGLDLMREGLLSRTQIPRVEDVDVECLLAKDTAMAVASAAAHSAAALVDRTMEQMRHKKIGPMKLICTGSDAEKLASLIQHPVQIERDLVVQGLHCLARAGVLQ